MTFLPGGDSLGENGNPTERIQGKCFAVEGDAEYGFLMLLLTPDGKILECRPGTDDVRVDGGGDSDILLPPPGTQFPPDVPRRP